MTPTPGANRPSDTAALPPAVDPPLALAWSETRVDSSAVDLPGIAFWTPRGLCAALGLSQIPENEIFLDEAARAGVNLVRRQSGGGTVLLYPGVLCWEAWAPPAVMAEAGGGGDIRGAYSFLTRPILRGLGDMGIAAVRAGVSDLAAPLGGDGELRKIAGVAQLRRRNCILVHGSLLVHADLSLLARFLRLPEDRPAYRRDRSHADFCTTLADALGARAADRGDLTAAVVSAVGDAARNEGWELVQMPDSFSPDVERLAEEKYRDPEWTLSRKRHPKPPVP